MATQTVKIPILYYHNLTESEDEVGDYTITAETFRSHLEALTEAGYTTISFEELSAWVNGESVESLPDNPIIITFDDGYESNYTLAYPILEEYGMKATIFVIGRSTGLDTYVDGLPMFPHFTLDEANEMKASGLIEICSHGYNFHQVEGRDPDPARISALKLDSETDSEYAEYMQSDLEAMKSLIGDGAYIIAYPGGKYDELSESVLSDLGVTVTVTTEQKISTVTKNDTQSLHLLGRISAESYSDAEELLSVIDSLINE